MQAKSNDSDLLARNVNPKYIYFYQLWQELINNFTLDVYQYRVLNSLNALIELESVLVKTISGLFTTEDNIRCCIDELLKILEDDTLLAKRFTVLLNRLRKHLNNYSAKEYAQKSLLFHVRYIIKELSPKYLHSLFCELEKEINNENIQLIEKYSNSIISQCVFLGWSPRSLFYTMSFFETDEDEMTKWNKFKYFLTQKSKDKYTVLVSFPINPSLKGEQLRNSMSIIENLFAIKKYDQLITQFSHLGDIEKLISLHRDYIEVKTEAHDFYTAAISAIRLVSDNINMASFYNLVAAWDLKQMVLIPINQSNNYHKQIKAKELYSTYDYLDISTNIFEITRKLFADSSKKDIHERLNGAFSYINISRASLFQEEKYMNMWVALESLTRTDMYSNIISNIKEIVPASLCIRYIYKHVRNFVEDCLRCGVDFNFSTVIIDLKQETKRQLVKEVIDVFQDDIIFNELKIKCSVNSLLSLRVESIKKLVTDVKFAKNKIENHYKRVKWQLQRLYRIRNEIAHSALHSDTSLIIYIEHLYDYLSTFITELVICIDKNKLFSLEEAYCVIKDNYEVFIDLTKEKESSFINDSIFANGVIELII